MNLKEFNRRCNEVFISKEGDYYSSIHVIGGRVIIAMEEENDDGERSRRGVLKRALRRSRYAL